MDSARWRRVEQIHQAVLERTPADRAVYLAEACGSDEELRRQVEMLLEAPPTHSMVDWLHRAVEPLLEQLSADGVFKLSPEPESPFRPGEVLDGRFRILSEVARGGMGIVYEAFDEKLQRRIAIKCAQALFRDRLPREVRNASEVSHPNVCKLFEIHTASTPHGEVEFLTMEFLEGETLAARLRRGPLPRPQALAIAQQICAGLAEAHRDNVIHGDLKSGNVILTKNRDGSERAVITDFGLARRPVTSAQDPPSVAGAGTPAYMAPELWRGEKATVASDIYALGVILHEMIAGHRPGQKPRGSSSVTITLPAYSGRQTPGRKAGPVDARWGRVLACCLNAEPQRRYHDAGEVARALTPPSRRRMLAAAAGVLIAVLTGVIAHQRAAAPLETVRLAVLPFQAAPDAAGAAATVMSEAAAQIARLKGTPRTAFQIVPGREVAHRKVETVENAKTALGATHALHGSVTNDRGKIVVEAFLADTARGVNATAWRAQYAPEELRFVGTALAGIVTGVLRLPPPAAVLGAAARNDYEQGLEHLRRDSHVDDGVAALERAAAADPASALAYAELARAQWLKYSLTADAKWLERATDSLARAQRRNPDLVQVHIMSGVLKAHEGWYEQAAAEYRRALEIDPGNGEAYRRLGSVYERTNQTEEALASIRRAVAADPSNYRNHQSLGAFFLKRANYEEAVRHFQKTVELAFEEPHPHYSLATAYQNLGRFSDAERELRLSIGLRETEEALQTLGQILMYEGRERDAAVFLQRALRLDPRQCVLWWYLETAYRRMNMPAEQRRAIRRGLELAQEELARNPRRGEMRSYLAYFCAREGQRARAESEAAQALRESPADADARWMAVMTYEALGRREAALAALAGVPRPLLEDLNRWPDAADLRRDRRFGELIALNKVR